MRDCESCNNKDELDDPRCSKCDPVFNCLWEWDGVDRRKAQLEEGK
jgi:hypothetical protein